MCDGEEPNPKQKKRKIVSTTPDNTSSGFGSGGGKYEVFLSFRGPDTRKAFTDFLFTLLVEKNIRTFRDNEELSVGEEIRPELLKAIEQSKIYIPILSQHYASTKSCLLELAHMVRCHKTGGKKIIPVFYDVEPSDVEHQRWSYEEAFRQHEKTRDQKTIQGWKDALKVVADLKGLSKKDTDGHEGALTKRIVEEVLVELKKNYMHVPDLVGMDHHVDKIRGLLNVESNGVRIVGIHGMGGLGKTTIAKFIYNQLCEDFECCCFLEDIRETSQQKGLDYLQSQLLFRILKGKCRLIDNVDNGIEEIRNAVNGKKVLIVLDDVDEKSQFEKLVKNCDWLGSGSRIIITTRNQGVLNGLKVTCKKKGQLDVYQPELMKDDDSLQLLSKHAFESLSPPRDYDTLSKEVVSYAAGLPLVLVVTGSLLRGEDKQFWEDTSKKLKKIPPCEVQKKLRISFDPLDDDQKEIFLDIACLFVGEDKTNLLYMWEDSGFYPETGINVLIRRSLIKVGDDNRIWMHDHVRDLGMRIVDEENLTDKGERSRLWRPEEALSIFDDHMGTNKVVAQCLDLPRPVENPPHCLVGKDFKELRNLRYLRLGCADLDGDFKHRFSNLRWLECCWGCRGIFKLNNLGLKNLVVLQLSGGHIADDWKGWREIKMATKLKVVHLSYCTHLTSASHFYSFETLERLILLGCERLKEIEPSVGNLTKLRVLHLSYCSSLRRVNCSTFSTLESLDLSDCGSLRSLDGLDQLKSLTCLNTSGCENLERLWDLSNLKRLKKLEISGCWGLIEIQGLDRLESLGVLNVDYCYSIKRLPDLSNLRMLKCLMLSQCKRLHEVAGLAALESLEALDMSSCTSLEKLPDLSSLKKFKTNTCFLLC